MDTSELQHHEKFPLSRLIGLMTEKEIRKKLFYFSDLVKIMVEIKEDHPTYPIIHELASHEAKQFQEIETLLKMTSPLHPKYLDLDKKLERSIADLGHMTHYLLLPPPAFPTKTALKKWQKMRWFMIEVLCKEKKRDAGYFPLFMALVNWEAFTGKKAMDEFIIGAFNRAKETFLWIYKLDPWDRSSGKYCNTLIELLFIYSIAKKRNMEILEREIFGLLADKIDIPDKTLLALYCFMPGDEEKTLDLTDWVYYHQLKEYNQLFPKFHEFWCDKNVKDMLKHIIRSRSVAFNALKELLMKD